MFCIWNSIIFFITLFNISNLTSASYSFNTKNNNNSKNIINCEATSYCDNMEACSSNGICYVDIFSYYNTTNTNRNTICVCNIGWISVDNYDVKCCYQQKQQAIAFLLEFLLGFGAGHWYVGNKIIAMIKTIFSSMLCVIIWVTAFFILYKKGDYELMKLDERPYTTNKINKLPILLMMGSIVCYFIWQLLDVLLFGVNYYSDGNGQQLQGW